MNHIIQALHDLVNNIVHLIPGHTLISKSGVSLSIIIPSLVLYWLPSSYVKESQRVASPPPPTTSDPLVEDAVPEDPSPIVSPVPVSEEPSTALVLTPPASPIPPTPQALPVTFVAPVDPVTLPLPASPPLPPPQPLPVTFIAPVDPATLLLPASPPPPTPQVLPVEPAPLEDSEEAELVPLETSEAVETREVADHAEQITEPDDVSPALEPELATTTTATVPEAIEVKSTTASIPPTATSVTTKEVSGASADEAHGFIHKLFHRSKTQKEAGPGNVAEALKPLNKEPSQDFESFWDSLPARDCLFAKESSKSFRAILSTPICSEDIQDVETVLREDREKGASSWDLCLIFRIRIPKEPIYGKTQDQDFFIRMGFQIKDSWTAGTTTDMFTRCDSRRPATDVRIRRQALQGFKVYHLLDLVNLACARGGWELERENPLRVRSSIGEGLMGSHLTQILADSLRPWHAGSPEIFELEKPVATHASDDGDSEDRLERAQTQRDAIFAKLEEDKAEMLTHTIRLTMKFMRHWGDWPWQNATGLYEPDARAFSEHTWSGHPLLFPKNYHPIVRTRSDPRQQMTRSTISLDMFYDSIMGTNSAPEILQIAFAEIDEIKIYRDDNTGVKHEFLVVCAKSQYESGETTSWVRIDRGQGRSTDGIWNANDTILCGSTPGGWLINRQSVQEISSLYLGGSVSRRPLVRDLVHAVGVLHKTFPEYTWHQHNCWFVANLITMTMRCLYGGEWLGDEAHWVWPQELHDFVTLCIDDLNFTRFNLGGLPETFPVIPVEQLFPTKDVFGRKTTHKSALPRVFSLLAHGAGAEASTSAAHSGSSGNKTKSATSTPSQSKVSSTTAVGDHKGTHTRASERTSESANSTDSASTASSSAASETHQAYGSQAIGPLGAMKRSWHDHRVFKSFAIAKSRFSPVKNLPDTVIKQPDSPKHFFSKRKSVV
ncbi:hypothetical protein DL93DRAFT_2171915 [Clavulina sp. PMI_390]|nr:hypothetical protein DL93DRAFT_2171915 [Clavulina sp. PMI_390]